MNRLDSFGLTSYVTNKKNKRARENGEKRGGESNFVEMAEFMFQ